MNNACGTLSDCSCYSAGMAQPRHKPKLSVTLDSGTEARLRKLHERMPGSNLSGIVDELLIASLPMFEAMADALEAARGDDGVVDEGRAKDRLAHWAGAQLLKGIGLQLAPLSDTDEEGAETG